ncbi:MAG TPA: hypothetical protein VLA22_06715 [Gaiellaceae bacterium]|nr:hypothetical protein [Gaiellaceae bacterium]
MRARIAKVALPVAIVAACLAGAIFSFLLAIDVATTSAALRDDDIRYRARPTERLWEPRQLVPGGMARMALGVDDDLLFRRALRATRLSHPEAPGFSDPSYVVNRADASAWLTDIVQGDPGKERRSAAANLLGVLSFSDAIADYSNRGRLLAAASGRFRQAIVLDPQNDEAKHNLELTLSRSQGLELSESGGGTNPSPGGKGAKGAGAGEAGSGY